MTPWLLLALAKHVAGSDTLAVSGDFFAILAFEGAPVSGVVAQAFTYAEPVVVSDTEVMWSNATEFSFNVPDGASDEVWVSDTSGFTNVWYRIPKPLTLVSGTPKVFQVGALDHNLLATA